MKKFKAGDKVKVVSSELESYWYADKVGNIYTLKSFDGEDWSVKETDFGVFAPCDLEFVEDEKESTSAWLKENKWFIRTGTKEKSELVQKWLFEHGMEWLYGKTVQSGFNDRVLTNTNCVGSKEKYIMFSMDDNKTNAQEIKIEFETIVKSFTLPTIESEKDRKIRELQETIESAANQIKAIKEGM